MMRQLTWVLGLSMVGSSTMAGTLVQTWKEPTTAMTFVSVPKGCFQMGSGEPVPPPANTMWESVGYKASLSENEQPQHEVCVDAFWIGKYEVRRKEWHALMGDEAKGEAVINNDDYPVVRVTWHQAQRFAQKLNERSGGKQRFRLPTEAEWEFACRAHEPQDRPSNQEHLATVARYGLGTPEWDRFGPGLGAAGQRQANDFGLHDMLGNVWEWTADAYQADAYTRHTLYNPRIDAPAGKHNDTIARVIRGASFRTEFQQVRCTKRGRQPGSEALDSVGFRLVREF